MKQHGLPVTSARNTAVMETVTDPHPIVVADLFGVSPGTAHIWAQFAQKSLAYCLSACDMRKESPQGERVPAD